MGTEEAFRQLISIRGWWIGVLTSSQSAYSYKVRFESGDIGREAMIRCLEKSKVFKMKKDIEWEKINQEKQ